jgi:hypothetical protein
MTADDIFLLFAAFGGFVIAPALLLWGFARITHRKQRGTSGPDIRPDVDSSDTSSGDGRREAARSGKANDFLRRLTGNGSGHNPTHLSRLHPFERPFSAHLANR